MPELSGMEAMAEVNRERLVPAVLVTAYQKVEEKPSYIVTCLSKPVRASDIQAAITLAAVTFNVSR